MPRPKRARQKGKVPSPATATTAASAQDHHSSTSTMPGAITSHKSDTEVAMTDQGSLPTVDALLSSPGAEAELPQDPQIQPFPFLELPPELRVHVYEELLILDDQRKCYPKILRTCKFIHREASEVLHHKNIFEINFRCCGLTHFDASPQAYSSVYRWEPILCNVRSLKLGFHSCRVYGKIRIKTPRRSRSHTLPEAPPPISMSLAASHALDSLCQFIAGSRQLRNLGVDFHNWRKAMLTKDIVPLPNLCAFRLLQHSKFTLTIHGASTPLPLVLDATSRTRRNAHGPEEARERLYRLIQSFDYAQFDQFLETALGRSRYAQPPKYLDNLLEICTVQLTQVCYTSDRQDRALLRIGELVAGNTRRWKYPKVFDDVYRRRLEGYEAVIPWAIELRATLLEARFAAEDLAATRRRDRIAAKEAKEALRKAGRVGRRGGKDQASKGGSGVQVSDQT